MAKDWIDTTMMLFPVSLISACEKEGIEVPNEEELRLYTEGNDKQVKEIANKYPHFHIFCQVQLRRPVRWGEHWENAAVIAKIPKEKLKIVTVNDLIERGLEYHTHPVTD